MTIRQATKDIFANSIMKLAKTKPVDTIRVREITKHCGLTSTTFYRHFQDKYQLLAWIYNRNIEELLADAQSAINWKAALITCCTPLQENRAFYKNVLKNTAGQTSFRYQTNDYAIALWMDYIRKREGLQEVPDEISFYFRFYMRALSEAINDWFLNGEKTPVEELAARIDAAMPEPLKPYLRRG